MHISVSEAVDKLDELVDRAEAADELVLLLDGRPAVRLVPVKVSRPTEPDSSAL
jgi:antitoxin (DNA-binding transcriptional repressor) of toxin-antitoxin stability system